MSTNRIIDVSLALLATTLLACGGELAPADIEATFYITSGIEPGEGRVLALYKSREDTLPEAAAIDTKVNESSLAFGASNGDGTFHLFRGSVALPAPDDPFAITLEMPGGTAEVSIPMVHPASFVTAGPPLGVAPGDNLQLAWTEAFPGERDWIFFRSRDPYVHTGSLPPEDRFGMVAVDEGASQVTVDAEVIEEWRRGLVSAVAAVGRRPESSFLGQVVLLRTRTAPTTPTFADGQVVVGMEIATMSVVLVP